MAQLQFSGQLQHHGIPRHQKAVGLCLAAKAPANQPVRKIVSGQNMIQQIGLANSGLSLKKDHSILFKRILLHIGHAVPGGPRQIALTERLPRRRQQAAEIPGLKQIALLGQLVLKEKPSRCPRKS